MPFFTEATIGTYLQISISVLIFGLGIPALIMQIYVPEEIRNIVHKWRFGFKWGAYLVAIAAIISTVFLWIFIPISESPIWFISNFFEYPRLIYFWMCGYKYQVIIAQVLVTVLVFLLLLFWLLQTSYRDDRIIKYLLKKCGRAARKNGKINETALLDIITISKRSANFNERIATLNSIKVIISNFINHPNYEGFSIDPFVQSIEAIINSADELSFNVGVKIIKDISFTLQEKEFTNTSDMGTLLRAFSRLGVIAINNKFDNAILTNLDIIITNREDIRKTFRLANKILFELGTLAIINLRFNIASAILNKFEMLLLQENPLTKENCPYYLGFVAHYMGINPSMDDFVRKSIKKMMFLPSIYECIDSATKFHYNNAAFETAEKIKKMIKDI